MDVEQPLMRADLKVLAAVLVLERRADHAVDVLLGGQRHRAGDGRARARGRLDDLLGRRLDRRVVVGLQANPNLVLRNRGHLGLGFSQSNGAGPGLAGPAPKGRISSKKAARPSGQRRPINNYSMTSVT